MPKKAEKKATKMGPSTRAIHAGAFDDQFGSVTPPLYQTSTYRLEAPGVTRGYSYTRTGNPTRDLLQNAIAELEEGTQAFVYSTGMAAENAILQTFLKPGDTVVVPGDLYGGTHRLLFTVMPQWGITTVRADYRDPKAVARAAKTAAMVWAESPTNPRLEVYDLPAITREVKKVNPKVMVVVDNTFATPMLQRPLAFGADIVMHSVTKYLAGHSDVIMGATVANDPAIIERLKFMQNATGSGAAPFDCWLVLRGIRTYPLRFKEHCRSAAEFAAALEKIDGISRVYYPGLAQHETHAVAKSTLSAFGGIVSIELEGGLELTRSFASKLKLFQLAESLGGVKSLANHPATMTHAAVPPAERKAIGLSDSLVRLSVGLEDTEDLVEDVRQALSAAMKESSVTC